MRTMLIAVSRRRLRQDGVGETSLGRDELKERDPTGPTNAYVWVSRESIERASSHENASITEKVRIMPKIEFPIQ